MESATSVADVSLIFYSELLTLPQYERDAECSLHRA
jgi:hypothetical protein